MEKDRTLKHWFSLQRVQGATRQQSLLASRTIEPFTWLTRPDQQPERRFWVISGGS